MPAPSTAGGAAWSGEAGAPCLVLNPHSFRASRGLAGQAEALARRHGAQVLRIDRFDALASGLDSALARRPSRLIVLAGDGTVHAIAGQLAGRFAAEPAGRSSGPWMPDLLILPGGRSNMLAHDLSPRGGGALAMLQRALGAGAEALPVTERRTLCVEQASAPARHGFFLGAALVDTIIRRIHRQRAAGDGPLQNGQLSTVWGLARLGFSALAGRAGLACPSLTIEADGSGDAATRLQGPVRLLLASTLQHAAGALDPYADRGHGELRVTAVARSAPRFWRTLPALATGRLPAALDARQGYLSGRFEGATVDGLAGYTLDGEEYDCDPAQPLRLSAGPSLRFVLP